VVAAMLLMPTMSRVFFPKMGEPHFGSSYDSQTDADNYSDNEGKNTFLPICSTAVFFGKKRHCDQQACYQNNDETY
jgi:hypothetical protein